MAHSHTVHLPLGALLSWCTVCGTGRLTPSLAALAAQVFVVVFAYDSASATATLIREFAQAAPPHAATVLGLPCGGYDPKKHGSMEEAARRELSEEVHLTGGTWHRLLPEGHPGILEAKWCRNRFTPFLCVDPAADDAPGARDAEEHIQVLRGVSLERLREAMAGGEMLPPSVQTCVSALERLRREGLLPAHL